MRHLFPLLVFAIGCASTAKEETKEEDWPMPKGFKLPPPSMWGNYRQHPVGGIEAGASVGELTYRSSGTLDDRDDDAPARLYRFSYRGRGGFDIDYIDSDDGFEGGTSANGLDAFSYYNLPLWPNNRLRFMNRPGFFFNAMNLVSTRPGDIEPWSAGVRWELEAEVDIIKNKSFILSLFGSGNLGYGWGEAKTRGTTVSIDSVPYGWEAGLRAHLHRWYLALTWVDQTTELRDSPAFGSAEYRFQGGALMAGFRW